MEEHSLYTHYLSFRKDVPDRELSENTKKIIALVESEDFLEANKYMLSDIWTLRKIVFSARADIRYKLELLDGIIEEFKDTENWEYCDRGKCFMKVYEPFRMAVDLMKSADNVSFTMTKVTRGENNSRSYDNNYPEFFSVDEISKYFALHFDVNKDSEDDPEWYIVWRYENNIKTSSLYLLSKCGTVWKCGVAKNDFYDYIGDEIDVNYHLVDYGDIFIFDRRPFHDICHVLYADDGGEDIGFYVEDGKLKIFPIEYHINDFEDIAFELRVAVQEDMSKLGEQEDILLLLQQKYHSMSKDDGYEWLADISYRICSYEMKIGLDVYPGTEGMPLEMAREEFLK